MSVQDLAQLKKLAEAATPGPWCYETVGDKSNEFVVGVAQHEGKMLTGCLNDQSYDEEAGVYIDEEIVRVSQVAINETGHANYSDARYIAAANPSTILALLAQLEQVERERDALKFEVDMLDSDRDYSESVFRSIARGDLRQQLMADNAHSAMKTLRRRKEESEARIAASGVAAVRSLAGDLRSALERAEASEAALRTLRQAARRVMDSSAFDPNRLKYSPGKWTTLNVKTENFTALAAALAAEGGK